MSKNMLNRCFGGNLWVRIYSNELHLILLKYLLIWGKESWYCVSITIFKLGRVLDEMGGVI